MSKRSSERRGQQRRTESLAKRNNASNATERRDRKRTERYRALSRMAWGDVNAARQDSGALTEMREGVMHSGVSPNMVYSRRNGGTITGITGVSDRTLYGQRIGQYRLQRDAAKVAKRQDEKARADAARAERARAQAERAAREGSGWA